MTSVLLSRLVPNGFTRELRYLVELTSPVTGTVLLEPLRRAWASSSEELGRLCESAFTEHPDGRAIAYFVDHRAASPTNQEKMPNVTVCKKGATTQDRARAVVENVGNIIVRMLEEFAEPKLLAETYPAEIDVAGGGSELDYLCQYISDVSGHTLTRVALRAARASQAFPDVAEA
jgi:sugar (pentulose or hexulose) kinase